MTDWGSRYPLKKLLSAASLGLLTAALFLMGGGVYFLVGRYLVHATEHRLRVRVSDGWPRLSQAVSQEHPRPEPQLVLRDNLTESEIADFVRSGADRDTLIRWYDRYGNLISENGGAPEAPAADSFEGSYALSRNHRERFLFVQWPIIHEGEVIGRIVAGAGLKPIDDLMEALLRYLMGTAAFVLLLGWWLSRRLAARVLRPVGTLVGTVEKVAAGDLSARTGLPPEGNELTYLAGAFDGMVERLQTSFAVRQQFVADASHELKTPLTSILAMSEMLELEQVTDAEGRRRAVGAISREAQRMNVLVNDLLELARSEKATGGVVELVRLEELAAQLVNELRLLQPERVVLVEGQAEVKADRESLRRLLRNLVENALRYSTHPVLVRLAPGSLQVIDEGSGIAATDLPFVFDRFYRADSSRVRVTGGSGLGLAIVKSIAEGFGGQVFIESKVGVGTTVGVTWNV